MPEATLKDIVDYFKRPGEKAMVVAKEIKELTESDREDIKRGLSDGSLTY